MNTRRIIPRTLVAAVSLLVLGVATTADAPSPAHASSVSATSAQWPSQGGVAAESPASTRVPAARYELHFGKSVPETSVFWRSQSVTTTATTIRAPYPSDGGSWIHVYRLVSSGEITDDILYYAQSADGKARWTSDYNKIWVNDNAPFRICRGAPGSEIWRQVGTLQVLLDSHKEFYRINLVP